MEVHQLHQISELIQVLHQETLQRPCCAYCVLSFPLAVTCVMCANHNQEINRQLAAVSC